MAPRSFSLPSQEMCNNNNRNCLAETTIKLSVWVSAEIKKVILWCTWKLSLAVIQTIWSTLMIHLWIKNTPVSNSSKVGSNQSSGTRIPKMELLWMVRKYTQRSQTPPVDTTTRCRRAGASDASSQATRLPLASVSITHFKCCFNCAKNA